MIKGLKSGCFQGSTEFVNPCLRGPGTATKQKHRTFSAEEDGLINTTAPLQGETEVVSLGME